MMEQRIAELEQQMIQHEAIMVKLVQFMEFVKDRLTEEQSAIIDPTGVVFDAHGLR